MLPRKKILFVAHEVLPFWESNSMSRIVHAIAAACVQHQMEARVIVPNLGRLSGAKRQIHEVVRLSCINVSIGPEDFSLVTRVGATNRERFQVYFAHSEQIFPSVAPIYCTFGTPPDERHLRALFLCKSALAISKCLDWIPDIIHCHGWMSAFLPLYVRSEPDPQATFSKSKLVYTLHETSFTGSLHHDLLRYLRSRHIQDTQLEAIQDPNLDAINRLAMTYADCSTQSFSSAPEGENTLNLSYPGVIHIPDDAELGGKYMNLYRQLLATPQV